MEQNRPSQDNGARNFKEQRQITVSLSCEARVSDNYNAFYRDEVLIGNRPQVLDGVTAGHSRK